MLKNYIETRVIEIADYILKTKEPLRKVAKVFCVSKSTAHKDVQQRLFWIDRAKYYAVKEILNLNFAQKHLRGGLATKQKYTV